MSRDRLVCASRPRILFPPTHLTHNRSKNGATMPLLIMQFLIFCALFCALTWATFNMVSLHAFRWWSMITGSRSLLRTGLSWYDSNDSKYFEEYKYCTRRAFPSSPLTNNVLLDLACRQWTLPEIMVQLLRLLLLETKHHQRSKCCAPPIHGHTLSEEVLFLHFASVTTSGRVLIVSPPSRWPASHRKFRFQLGTAQATTNIGTNAART
jgi:hypothetical protein